MPPSKPRVKSLYHLVRGARTETTLPEDVNDRRRELAAQHVLANRTISSRVLDDYGHEFERIFDNAVWSTHSQTGRDVQTMYNFGLSPPTDDMKEVAKQTVHLFREVIRPLISSKCKLVVLVGTLTDYVGDGDDPDNPKNTKFFRPDFNSSITPQPVAIGLHGNDPSGMEADAVHLEEQLGLNGGTFQMRRSDQANTKYRLALFTNVTFRIFHAAMEPIIGACKPSQHSSPKSASTRRAVMITCAFSHA
jgi:hypothetical protein